MRVCCLRTCRHDFSEHSVVMFIVSFGCTSNLAKCMQEMLLREDNYNNHFANGGAGRQKLAVGRASSSAQEVADWMLKKRPSLNAQQSLKGGGKVPGKLRSTRSGSAYGADIADQ